MSRTLSFNSFQKRFPLSSVEKLALGYLWLTGLFVIAGGSRIGHEEIHLGIRVLLSLVYLLMARYVGKESGEVLRFVRAFFPLVLLAFLYNETDFLNNILLPDQDVRIAGLEERIFGCQPSLVFSFRLSMPWFNELMYFGYFSYFLLITGFLFYLYQKKQALFSSAIFTITGAFYLYYLFFCIYPAAGPQFYFLPPDSEVPASYFFSHLIKWIQSFGERPTGAFPSSHIGVAYILLFLIRKENSNHFFISLPFVLLLTLSTVYIKAHYLLDVIGGLISVPLVLWILSGIEKRIPGST